MARIRIVAGALLAVSLQLLIVSCNASTGSGCSSDRECNGGRICVEGSCERAGSDGETGTTATSGGLEPTPARCPFNRTSATAVLDEGLVTAANSANAEFTSGGALAKVDGMSCSLQPSAPDPTRFNPEAHDCAESYTCGGCRFWILDNSEVGFILAGDSEETCPSYAGFFLLEPESGGAATSGNPSTGSSGGSSCGEPCPSGCCSPTGLICCQPPFCAGDCVGSPCCG